ncbi:MAG: triose-phosphate isomerase [Bdellovibrionota bacterium]
MPIFAGNWKLQKNPAQTRAFFKEFVARSGDLKLKSEGNASLSAAQAAKPGMVKPPENVVVFFPPAPCWEASAESLKDSPIQWGGQNIYIQNSGAFTGENSPQTLAEMGAKFALVGHSERRQLFHEGDDFLSMKVNALQSLGLTPVLCIGESLSQRENKETETVLLHQLTKGLEKASKEKPIIIAYEPVWAIGTGKVATEDQVRDAHLFIEGKLRHLGFQKIPILYGGSVKAENSKGLLKIPHVDGFLVGGASLDVDSFLAICRSNLHA